MIKLKTIFQVRKLTIKDTKQFKNLIKKGVAMENKIKSSSALVNLKVKNAEYG